MKNANLVSACLRVTMLALGVMISLATAGCDRDRSANVAPKTVADRFDIKLGKKTVKLQLAVRENEMTQGLMGRQDLARDDGMLFIYPRPQRMSFWMHNTPTPLDIGFFDATGTLQEVYPLHPFDETSVSSRSSQLSFALEMNQGWYHDNEIKPGAKLDIEAVAAALKARGFEPYRFGLQQ